MTCTAKIKIEISDLCVSFGETKALRQITMGIEANEILAIIGPANSGKSSLVIAINRMIERVRSAAVSGSIKLDGKDVSSFEDVETLRRHIGMVFAFPIPLPMSIRQNILFGPKLIGGVSRSKGDDIVESTLKAAYLWDEVKDRLDSSAIKLSGGQQQRLCIARTLAVEPEVLMFDEPCSGLDPISTAKVEDAMKELKKTHTILLVTNNTKQAARASDRTAFLCMGELIELDRTEKIFTNPSNRRTEEYVTGQFG